MKKQQTLIAFLTILADLGCYQYFEHKDRKLIVVFNCHLMLQLPIAPLAAA